MTEDLFQAWLNAEKRLSEVMQNRPAHALDNWPPEDKLSVLSEGLFQSMLEFPARSVEDLAIRMAAWRRMAPEDELSWGESLPEMVTYCVFRDLVAISGRTDLLQPSDEVSRTRAKRPYGMPSKPTATIADNDYWLMQPHELQSIVTQIEMQLTLLKRFAMAMKNKKLT